MEEEEEPEYDDDELTPEDSIIYDIHCWAAREADRKPNIDNGEFDHPVHGTVHGMVCYDAESRDGDCLEYSCPLFEGMYFSADPDTVTSYYEWGEEEEEEEERPIGINPPGSVRPSGSQEPVINPAGVRPVEALGNAAKAALADAGSQIMRDVVTEGLQGAVNMGKQAVKDTAKTLFQNPNKESES